jgi:transcriptional regulator with XRE-family HTH domain
MGLLRLDRILSKKGMTGKELAERTGVTANTISSISSNKSFPKAELLKSIAEVLDVDVRELFNPTKTYVYDQKKHEQLVNVINGIEGKNLFSIKPSQISHNEIEVPGEILNAGILITDVLNIRSGSSGDFQLYDLLQKYFNDEIARKEINKIVKK